ncbi:MAG: SAM-dependent chlorinase/fluorinase [Bacteroidota bacterium]
MYHERLLFITVPAGPLKHQNNVPHIALVTDFGLLDHYVGVMKGVFADLCPEARIIDITHAIHSQNVLEGGYVLWASYRFFPRGTIFVAIVDPGVGSERKIVGLQTEAYTFLAPDNGLLDFISSEHPTDRLVEIPPAARSVKGRTDRPVSATFHGRDIFAPVAARVANGDPLSLLGKHLPAREVRPPFFDSTRGKGRASLLLIDHFGNMVTNIRGKEAAVTGGDGEMRLSVHGRTIKRWVRTFDEAPDGKPCLLVGSSGLVEIVVKNDSAAAYLGADLSTPISVVPVS